MPPALASKRITACTNCGRRLVLVPGDTATACQDLKACNARKLADLPTPAIARTAGAGCRPAEDEEDETPPGSAEDISKRQRLLAVRAIALTGLTMDKIQDALENGTQITLKDGTVSQQDIQPMALATIMRELRPIAHEPVRAQEASKIIDRPLVQINLSNTDEVRDAVTALRARRDRQLEAKQPMQLSPARSLTTATETALEAISLPSTENE